MPLTGFGGAANAKVFLEKSFQLLNDALLFLGPTAASKPADRRQDLIVHLIDGGFSDSAQSGQQLGHIGRGNAASFIRCATR